MVPSEKSLGEFPELLQVGELSKIIIILETVLPIQRFSQENLTSTLIKQDQIYYIKFGSNIFKNKLIAGEIMEETREDPPNEGKIKKIKIIVPNLLKKDSAWYAYCFGRIPTNIFPPSKG